jgi:signal transduction histidine kinase
MKLKFIWSLSLPTTLLIGLGLGAIWLLLLAGLGGEQPAWTYINNTNSGLVAIILVCAFMVRLKASSQWQQNLLDEIFPVGATVLLFISALYLLMIMVSPPGTFAPDDGQPNISEFFLGIPNPVISTWLFTLIFGGGSYVLVRLSAWIYYFWNNLRRRSLVWEITHTQLRLVMLATYAGLLFYVSTLPDLYRRLEIAEGGSGRFLQLLTTLIVLLGFTGVVTGILFVIVLVPATVLSYFSARQITRRLDKLVETTTALSAGNYNTRVTVEGKDEVARLQTNFNLMADTLDEYVQKLQTEKQAIARLLESRQTLFAGVSHELRTPVATLRSYLEIVRQKSAVPPELENYLRVMEDETFHLQRLIDDLFMLARSDVRQLELNLRPLDVVPVLRRCIEAARLQAWQSKKLDVALEIRPPLPPICADETRLEQIVNNLLKNAVRHTMPGGIVAVSVEVESEQLAIIVRDTGEGIAPSDLPHIWERFYRSADARASDRSGAGLGLPIVKELTTAMGGTVEVESTLGEGSCFSIRLPLAG